MRKSVIIAIIILLICAVHCINLGADTPSYVDRDIGLYVDEGYKTLSPRNLVLFGSAQWNRFDEYPGWFEQSPLTQWAYYIAFLFFGPDIQSARLMTVLFYFLFLSGFAWSFKDIYLPKLLYSGLLILGIESALFFYSRVALFEMPLIFLTYSALFLIKRGDTASGLYKASVICLALLLSYFLVKKTAFIYLLPVVISITVLLFIRREIFTCLRRYQFSSFLILFLAGLALLTYPVWSGRIHFSLKEILNRIAYFNLIETSPITVLCGMACISHGLLYDPKRYLNDYYRLSLLSIILFSPLILAFFPYNPLRYYIPILPAYILITLEWWYQTSNKTYVRAACSGRGFLLSLPFMVLTAFYLVNWMTSLLYMFPEGVFMWVIYLCLFAILISSFIIYLRKSRLVSPIMVGLVLFYTYNTIIVGSFLFRPSYRSTQIRSDIEKIIPSGSVIAGEWAPFFTLNTGIKSIYLTRAFNPPERVGVLRPDYFLFNAFEQSYKSYDSYEMVTTLRSLDGIGLEEPIYKNNYLGFDIIIFPIKYKEGISPHGP